jgi:LAGLIDADG-like domain/Homeodomain-like domain
MHPHHVRAEALALVAAGLNDCEISRRLGVPRRTILDWRRPTYVSRRTTPVETCPRCWRATKPIRFTADDYAELLGMYLGDGCISPAPRTSRLRIALDAKYPVIIEELRRLLARAFPENRVALVEAPGGTMYFVSVHSSHLPCLFPQHGPGHKHTRAIKLESWQQRLVQASPFAFLRGCIRSDGCVFINRTDVHRPRPYQYLSYQFTNMSKDIVDLFVGTCERVGVFTRVTRSPKGLWNVRINRRESVARLLEHVGPKR